MLRVQIGPEQIVVQAISEALPQVEAIVAYAKPEALNGMMAEIAQTPEGRTMILISSGVECAAVADLIAHQAAHLASMEEATDEDPQKNHGPKWRAAMRAIMERFDKLANEYGMSTPRGKNGLTQ